MNRTTRTDGTLKHFVAAINALTAHHRAFAARSAMAQQTLAHVPLNRHDRAAAETFVTMILVLGAVVSPNAEARGGDIAKKQIAAVRRGARTLPQSVRDVGLELVMYSLGNANSPLLADVLLAAGARPSVRCWRSAMLVPGLCMDKVDVLLQHGVPDVKTVVMALNGSHDPAIAKHLLHAMPPDRVWAMVLGPSAVRLGQRAPRRALLDEWLADRWQPEDLLRTPSSRLRLWPRSAARRHALSRCRPCRAPAAPPAVAIASRPSGR